MWGSVSASASDAQPPGVTAIMPFGDARRIAYARRAVAAFAQQSYQHKQLVIANSSGTAVLDRPRPGIRELTLPRKPATVGALRNAALAHADGSWILHWDDDDYAHPALIAHHVAHRRAGLATLLTHQVRFNGLDASAYMHAQAEGIPATLFYPRPGPDADARYPDADRHDTEAFWIEHWGLRTAVLGNHRFPWNGLSVAIYHAYNVAPVADFMVGHAGFEFAGQWELGGAEAGYLQNVLAGLGMPPSRAAAVEDDGTDRAPHQGAN